MIEVLRVETGERLRLEPLKGERVAGCESLVEHPLDASSGAAVVTLLRLELRCGLLRLDAGNEAVMVGVEHLEQHVGALLSFRAGPVPSSAIALSQERSRDERCAQRDRDEQSLHASQSLRSRVSLAQPLLLCRKVTAGFPVNR
jgi:hypothetical protein